MADLFAPPPLDQWPAELRFLAQERAAIREFCGGATQAEAVNAAISEIWQKRLDLTGKTG